MMMAGDAIMVHKQFKKIIFRRNWSKNGQKY